MTVTEKKHTLIWSITILTISGDVNLAENVAHRLYREKKRRLILYSMPQLLRLLKTIQYRRTAAYQKKKCSTVHVEKNPSIHLFDKHGGEKERQEENTEHTTYTQKTKHKFEHKIPQELSFVRSLFRIEKNTHDST